MTYFPSVETKSLTLLDGTGHAVATASTVKNNRGQDARVSIQFQDGLPAEIETIPGKDSFKPGTIIAQHILWGPETHDGKNRNRITTSITADGDGGLSAVIDSTTNDPSGSDGQRFAMPLVLNAGEAKGLYLVFYPSDNTISLQDRSRGIELDRVPMRDVIDALAKNISPKL